MLQKSFSPDCFERIVAPGLESIFGGKSAVDSLNELMLRAQVPVREVTLLRSYAAYLWQLKQFPSRDMISDALAHNPEASATLLMQFRVRFDPGVKNREALAARLDERLETQLQRVHDLTHDRVIRSTSQLIKATMRSNFYCCEDTFAFKVHSAALPFLPEPRPYMEIFVYSPRVEGVHLRLGPKARGGIRDSDRPEDYRTEVLGLLFAQFVKNSVIVPTAAKGGYFVRSVPLEPEARARAHEEGYDEFIDALLSVTDNKIRGNVEHPRGLVIYDGPDPYFVVAADKGTAKYSDRANAISIRRGFWLEDAFASGGKHGYDHKVLGITARGAWESIKRHFLDLGIDINRPFDVVGIGDMSGDVFGNGMLYSRNIRLLAAFDHRHIFIDPDPELDRSFEERERLFRLKKSSWADFNRDVLSSEGIIVERSAKEIRVTHAIRRALSLSDQVADVISGEEMIKHILRTKCDLLYPGGVGTYIKSSEESHADADDAINDRVRINGNELRARVSGEGANLAFTQLGRIEYTMSGGRCNNDATDNSAGVATSDLEVNLKILLNNLVERQEISENEKRQVVVDLTDWAAARVLKQNYAQNLLLSRDEHDSVNYPELYKALSVELHRRKIIDRDFYKLPSDDEISLRAKEGQGFLRPELCVCLSGAKLWMKECLSRMRDLDERPEMQTYLRAYFPPELERHFLTAIRDHDVAKEIVQTQLANSVVNAFGITFIYDLIGRRKIKPETAMNYTLGAEAVTSAEFVRESLRTIEQLSSYEVFMTAHRTLRDGLQNLTNWLIDTHGRELSLKSVKASYSDAFTRVLGDPASFVSPDEGVKIGKAIECYQVIGLDPIAAKTLAVMPHIDKVFDRIYEIWRSRHSASAEE